MTPEELFLQDLRQKQQMLDSVSVPQPDANGEFLTPADGALFMAAKGIPQIPLRGKAPFFNDWPNKASNNPEQIKKWAEEHPGCNFGSVAHRGKFFVFEADSLNVRNRMKDTGHDFTSSFIVESSSNRGHRYYRYAEGVENIGQDTSTLHGDFSLRVDNEQCVSPGSINPKNGRQYRVIQNGDIKPPSMEEIAFWNSEKKSNPVESENSNERDINSTWMDDPIPDGKRNSTLTAIAGNLRRIGLNEDDIYAALSSKNQNQCTPPLRDEEIQTIAKSVARYMPAETTLLLHGVAIDGVDAIKVQADKIQQSVDEAERWRFNFKTVRELEEGEVQMLINGFLPEGTTFIGGLPGEGKTLFALSIVKALTTGNPFLRRFMVPRVTPVLYLIPESGGRAFRKRCERFGIPDDPNLFLCRTVSEGVTLDLNDASVLAAVKKLKPVVILDTLIRFSESDDENDAMQNKKLVDDVISLRQAGAVGVIGIHHATKIMRTQGMTLESALRGTGDIAACADAVYGLLRDSTLYANGSGPNQIDVACLKPRDFDPPVPFRIAATQKSDSSGLTGLTPDIVSVIDAAGDFLIVREGSSETGLNEKLVNLVTEFPDINVRELVKATGAGEWLCRKNLKQLGWSKTKGGRGGASTWFKRPVVATV